LCLVINTSFRWIRDGTFVVQAYSFSMKGKRLWRNDKTKSIIGSILTLVKRVDWCPSNDKFIHYVSVAEINKLNSTKSKASVACLFFFIITCNYTIDLYWNYDTDNNYSILNFGAFKLRQETTVWNYSSIFFYQNTN
jgi:hypothetical protein